MSFKAIRKILFKCVTILTTLVFCVSAILVDGAFALQPQLNFTKQRFLPVFRIAYGINKAAEIVDLLESGKAPLSVQECAGKKVFLKEKISGLAFSSNIGEDGSKPENSAEIVIEIADGVILRYFDPSKAPRSPEGTVPAKEWGLDAVLSNGLSRELLYRASLYNEILENAKSDPVLSESGEIKGVREIITAARETIREKEKDGSYRGGIGRKLADDGFLSGMMRRLKSYLGLALLGLTLLSQWPAWAYDIAGDNFPAGTRQGRLVNARLSDPIDPSRIDVVDPVSGDHLYFRFCEEGYECFSLDKKKDLLCDYYFEESTGTLYTYDPRYDKMSRKIGTGSGQYLKAMADIKSVMLRMIELLAGTDDHERVVDAWNDHFGGKMSGAYFLHRSAVYKGDDIALRITSGSVSIEKKGQKKIILLTTGRNSGIIKCADMDKALRTVRPENYADYELYTDLLLGYLAELEGYFAAGDQADAVKAVLQGAAELTGQSRIVSTAAVETGTLAVNIEINGKEKKLKISGRNVSGLREGSYFVYDAAGRTVVVTTPEGTRILDPSSGPEYQDYLGSMANCVTTALDLIGGGVVPAKGSKEDFENAQDLLSEVRRSDVIIKNIPGKGAPAAVPEGAVTISYSRGIDLLTVSSKAFSLDIKYDIASGILYLHGNLAAADMNNLGRIWDILDSFEQKVSSGSMVMTKGTLDDIEDAKRAIWFYVDVQTKRNLFSCCEYSRWDDRLTLAHDYGSMSSGISFDVSPAYGWTRPGSILTITESFQDIHRELFVSEYLGAFSMMAQKIREAIGWREGEDVYELHGSAADAQESLKAATDGIKETKVSWGLHDINVMTSTRDNMKLLRVKWGIYRGGLTYDVLNATYDYEKHEIHILKEGDHPDLDSEIILKPEDGGAYFGTLRRMETAVKKCLYGVIWRGYPVSSEKRRGLEEALDILKKARSDMGADKGGKLSLYSHPLAVLPAAIVILEPFIDQIGLIAPAAVMAYLAYRIGKPLFAWAFPGKTGAVPGEGLTNLGTIRGPHSFVPRFRNGQEIRPREAGGAAIEKGVTPLDKDVAGAGNEIATKKEPVVQNRSYDGLPSGKPLSARDIIGYSVALSKQEKYPGSTPLDRVRSTGAYLDANANAIRDEVEERTEPVLIRVPIEVLEADASGAAKEGILALERAGNIFIELYASDNPDERIGNEKYEELGIEKKEFIPQRSRENTVNIIGAMPDMKKGDIHMRLQVGESFKDSVVVPMGIKGDPSGILRAGLLGLRLIRIARQPGDDDYVKKTAELYNDLIGSYGMGKIGLNSADILALAGHGDINGMINALKKMIDSLPIDKLSLDEIRAINEKALSVQYAA